MPHDFIQRGIQAARVKNLAGLYLLPTFPPVGVPILEDVLWSRLRLALFGAGFRLTVD